MNEAFEIVVEKENNRKGFFNFYLQIFLYKILLDYFYVEFIATVFGYEGFDVDFEWWNYSTSILLTLFLAYTLPKSVNTPSKLIIYLFFFIVLIPILSYQSLSKQPNWQLYSMLLQFLITIFFSTSFFSRKKSLFASISIRNGTSFIVKLSNIIVFGSLLYVYLKTGGGLNFDLTAVYEFREEATLSINSGLMAYIVTWSVKVFNTLLIVFYLKRKKYLFFSLHIVIQILFFALLAQKSILFAPIVLIFTFVLFEKIENKRRFLLFSFLSFLIVIGVFSLNSNNIMVGSMFLRRLLYLPAKLNFEYYEFFSKNEFVLLSNSYPLLIEYPYKETTAKTIGLYLGTESSANTGFLATSYMHLGFFGIIVFPILVGLLLKALDKICAQIPYWIGSGITLIPFVSLVQSSDLMPALFTHGLLVSLFLLTFFKDLEGKSK